MAEFWKTAGLILTATILGLTIGKTEKNIAVLLSVMACCAAASVVVCYLEPVFSLMRELCATANIQNGVFGILLKAAGIALVSELACTICTDAGSNSLGKMLQLLGSATILYLSLPVVQNLLSLLREILAEL